MSVPRPLRALPLIVALALLLPACASFVPIHSTRPGPVAVGAARHLVILDGEGRPSARETIALELARQARGDHWFTVEDLSADGHRVWISGRRAKVRPRYPLEEESAGLRIDVHEWQAAQNSHTVERKDPRGEFVEETVRSLEGSVVLAVTLFDPWGRILLTEREYEGVFSGTEGVFTRDEVIENAAADAVAGFLVDVTPQTVVAKVRLDEGDPGQAEILEVAKAGDTAVAARRLEAYAQRQPDNAAAAYNLAVLLDAMGERQEALAWYDRALALGPEGYYASARADCAGRIADAEALLPAPPPAAYAR